LVLLHLVVITVAVLVLPLDVECHCGVETERVLCCYNVLTSSDF
jgi:hypothetical protein